MAVKKITWRWLFNSFGVIVIIILIVEIIFAYGISEYYYSSVRQALSSRAELVGSVFSQYNEGSSTQIFRSQVRDYVASFSDKQKIELMTINSTGAIELTSSGFEPDNKSFMPDYQNALAALTKTGLYVGDSGGERVMAMCFLSTLDDNSVSAVRLVVSLRNVDRQIAFWIVCLVALGILVLLLVLFSSSYFLSSIVSPIGEVSNTARMIAAGDFGARLTKKSNDEIGELCDTINYMADKLSEAEKLKNDFISSVSHELRTPLTAIQGWAETLLDDSGTDKIMLRRGMDIIISETGRLAQMVEELLDFSRMQSGRLALNLDKMDPLAELSEVALIYAQRATREGIEIVLNDFDLIVPMMGDKNKIKQVFVNIIDNSVKYSNPGGVIVIDAALKDSLNLEIVIKDNGIGISEDDLPKVKDKFFKANSVRRSSGIGLAVADEIVTRHGGTLDIDSVLGKGTTVTITLPLLERPAAVVEDNV